jgi:hypothetical protein
MIRKDEDGTPSLLPFPEARKVDNIVKVGVVIQKKITLPTRISNPNAQYQFVATHRWKARATKWYRTNHGCANTAAQPYPGTPASNLRRPAHTEQPNGCGEEPHGALSRLITTPSTVTKLRCMIPDRIEPIASRQPLIRNNSAVMA